MHKLYFHYTQQNFKASFYDAFYIASIKTLEGCIQYYTNKHIEQIYGIGHNDGEFFYNNYLLYPLTNIFPQYEFTYNNASTYKKK